MEYCSFKMISLVVSVLGDNCDRSKEKNSTLPGIGRPAFKFQFLSLIGFLISYEHEVALYSEKNTGFRVQILDVLLISCMIKGRLFPLCSLSCLLRTALSSL